MTQETTTNNHDPLPPGEQMKILKNIKNCYFSFQNKNTKKIILIRCAETRKKTRSMHFRMSAN